MAVKETDIARMLHSRGVMVVMAILMLAGAFVAFNSGKVSYISGDRGILFPSANLWVTNHQAEMLLNCGLTMLAAMAMLLLNRTFNLLRTVSQIDATLFMAMSLATPGLLCQLFTGTPLILTLLACLFLTYSSYASPQATPRVFLTFLLLSAGTMTQYCYAVYVPVFFASLIQMRIFNGRSVTAALLGLVTPWWIALGSGMVTVNDLHFPDIAGMFGNIFAEGSLHMLAVVAFTAALLVVGWCMNFMKMLSYNAHLRAYTGTLSLLALVTLLALAADFSNVYAYAPVLYMSTSFQFSHLLANRGREHTAAIIASVIAIYIMIYLMVIAL